MTTGTGILTAEAKDGHPAVQRARHLDHGHGDHAERRTPFTLKDGAWEASYGRTLTLKDDNEPPVRNIGLSDGSKHEITWGEPTLHDEGRARGHRLRRDPGPEMAGHPDRRTRHRPHGPHAAVAAARQAYDQGAGEYTARASRTWPTR